MTKTILVQKSFTGIWTQIELVLGVGNEKLTSSYFNFDEKGHYDELSDVQRSKIIGLVKQGMTQDKVTDTVIVGLKYNNP